jgi:hypothetical protein
MPGRVPRARWLQTIWPAYRRDAGEPEGHAVARARWRRCFAFSLALPLLARIVLLPLAILFICGSDLGGIGPKCDNDCRARRELGARSASSNFDGAELIMSFINLRLFNRSIRPVRYYRRREAMDRGGRGFSAAADPLHLNIV